MQQYVPRPEHPRPDFERDNWLNLNGQWEFEFDDDDKGEAEGWHLEKGCSFSREITVPFCYQCRMSGINDDSQHEIMWYRRRFDLLDTFKGMRILLNFGAVDYYAKVWVNGIFLGSHKGGYVPFKMEITNVVKEKDNIIVVRIEDKYDTVQPRGKQYWKQKPDRCLYTATSGIWQTVWLEAVQDTYVDKIRLTPDIDQRCVFGEVFLDKMLSGLCLEIDVRYKGESITRSLLDIHDRENKFILFIKEEDSIQDFHYWTPATPNLYDVRITVLRNAMVVDSVKTYFGMRKIAVEGDQILLNNSPLYQKLVLDQGYWPESSMTPPSDEAIRLDIEMAKKMGFNGVRKHQKIEDPRFYYWADRLGLLVWGEMPSAFSFNIEETENIAREWNDFINRDYNHPSIITWVPLNESWGTRNIFKDRKQQSFGLMLYYYAKALDATRLISTNDGWENIHSDIFSIHDYMPSGKELVEKYKDRSQLDGMSTSDKMLVSDGFKYEGQPVMITEYGGIAFDSGNQDAWFYSDAVKDEKSFFERYSDVTGAIRQIKYIRGFCYTQLTDVMQEINGLMTADRKLKVSLEEIRRING